MACSKEFLTACKKAADESLKHARAEVNLFCDIIGISRQDADFVGNDPHGVVSIGDFYFNMSDIHEVIVNLSRLVELHGCLKAISDSIIEWYDWTTEWYEKHAPMDWHKVERYNEFTGVQYDTPPIPEGRVCSGPILFKTKEYGTYKGIYCSLNKRFDATLLACTYSVENVSHWMELREPDDTHNINLRSWLFGASELAKKGE